MIKGAVLEKIKDVLEEWLLGFDTEQDFNVALFSTEKVNLKNAMINPDRVNKELALLDVPFRLKAGMIGRLSVKVSWRAFNIEDKFDQLVLRVSKHRSKGHSRHYGHRPRQHV